MYSVRFEILTVVSLKMAEPNDGGGKDLRNVGEIITDCTAEQPRRQPLSICTWFIFVLIFCVL